MVEDLFKAIEQENIVLVHQLLQSGADPNLQTDFGYPTPNFDVSPLMLAAERGLNEIVLLLLQFGSNHNAQDIGGWTALMKAAAFGHTKVVREMIENGADVN